MLGKLGRKHGAMLQKAGPRSQKRSCCTSLDTLAFCRKIKGLSSACLCAQSAQRKKPMRVTGAPRCQSRCSILLCQRPLRTASNMDFVRGLFSQSVRSLLRCSLGTYLPSHGLSWATSEQRPRPTNLGVRCGLKSLRTRPAREHQQTVLRQNLL